MVNTIVAKHYTGTERKWIARTVFLFIFCSLVYAWLADILPHQLRQPVIRYPYVDPAYWIFHWLQLPEFITGNSAVAMVFDVALLLCSAGCFILPDNRWLIIVFIVLYFIYFIIFNSFGAHHTSHKIGMVLMAVPFTVRNIASFNFLWQGLRYLLLFSFSAAFLFKVFRGSWFHTDQGISIMKRNMVEHLYYNGGTLFAGAQLANAMLVAGVLMEGLFIIGFFTKKYDRWLLLNFVLLVIGFLLVADAHFFEMLVWGLTLISFHQRKNGDLTPVVR